ncbi:MAG TPA: zf-HC2 domain-containing protein [Bryobacteraceae bacterium]|nr:zf-HC2 domain-containing protein [Bryobacteraceae bacterium]
MGCSLTKSAAEELIVGYAAGTLDPAARAEFGQHVISCGSCRELLAQQSAVWSALDQWQPLPVSPDFDGKLADRIARSPRASGWNSIFVNWTWRPLIPLAAACAILVFALLLTNSTQLNNPPPGNRSTLRIEQQVERALDDMDLLKQVGADVSIVSPAQPQKI